MAGKKKHQNHSDSADALSAAGVTPNDSGISVSPTGVIVGDESANTITARGGSNTIRAGGGNDKITTGSGRDKIWGNNDNDKIKAGNGKNWVKAGSGNDKVTAGKGADKIWGDSGKDNIKAGNGKNLINGGSGSDLIKGGTGSDKVLGGSGNDKIYAGNGNNWVNAGGGADRIITGNGNDTIVGGSGNDFIVAGLGNNTIDGGAGTDTVTISGSVFQYSFSVTSLTSLRIQHVSTSRVDKISNAEILKFDDDTIHLNGRNNAPFAKDFAVALNENSSAQQINLLNASNAFDVEGSTLQVTSVTPNGTVLGNVGFDGVAGTLTYDLGTAFGYLNIGQTATESVDFTISDGTNSITRTVTFTITGTITGSPNPPIAQDDAFSTDENTTLAGNVFADNGNGADTEADGDGFMVLEINGLTTIGTPVMLSSGALVTIFADGSFTYDSNDAFDVLTPGMSDTDAFTYTIRDSSGLTDQATVTINIDGAVNAAPTPVDDEADVVKDQTVTFDVLANDTDPEGDAFTITSIDGQSISSGGTVTVLVSGAQVTLNLDGTLTYDPIDDTVEVGDNFAYTVTDGSGNSASATVSIAIIEPTTERFGSLIGNDGNGVLNGTSGDDVIFGQADDERLFGDAGDDVLAGGAGTDEITGGLGNDRFVFSTGDGNDTITDFEVGSGDDIIDVLELTGFGTNFAALDTNGDQQLTAADAAVTASTGGLTLHLGLNDTLTLDDVTTLKEGHLLFI